MMTEVCINLEGTKSWIPTGRRPRYFGMIYCRSTKNLKGVAKEVRKAGCKHYPKSKTSFKCPDYEHYMKAYDKMNKVI
jgi:hypothetical protein